MEISLAGYLEEGKGFEDLEGEVFRAVCVLLALSPLFLDPSYVTILLLSFLFLVLATNYELVGGYLGYVNLGQGAFFGIGSYVVVALLNNKGM